MANQFEAIRHANFSTFQLHRSCFYVILYIRVTLLNHLQDSQESICTLDNYEKRHKRVMILFQSSLAQPNYNSRGKIFHPKSDSWTERKMTQATVLELVQLPRQSNFSNDTSNIP